jgi:type VI secretion system secreted protein Hcp
MNYVRRNFRRILPWLPVCLIYLLPILCLPGVAAIYMKLGTIKGESTAAGYEDWIEIQSLQWGVGRGISSSAGGADREASTPSVSEVTVSKTADKSSPYLFFEAVAGTAGIDAELHVVQTGKTGLEPYFKFKLYNSLISGLSQSSGGDRPSESLSLNFTKIEMTHRDSGGAEVTKSYDLESGKAQ